MAHLTILIHRGCLSDRSVQRLAEEIRIHLPDWSVEITPAELTEESRGIMAFPAFIAEGVLLATGLPRTDWLVNRLREFEGDRGSRKSLSPDAHERKRID